MPEIDFEALGRTVITVCVGVIGLGIGVTVTIQNFKDSWKNPKPLIVGLVSQISFMPFMCYLLAKTFNLSVKNVVFVFPFCQILCFV
jgi:predicted Na+-dependent transporter